MLAESDLAYSNLGYANLSYTDLTRASPGGADISNAKLDHAIWLDGRLCAPGSQGQCLAAAP